MAPEIRYSGGPENQSGIGSLGGVMSNTVITTDVLENLFDNVTRTESLLGKSEFRCFYILNPSADAVDLPDFTIEFNALPTFTDISIGVDPASIGDGVTTGVATTIATEDTTPTGVRFFDRENDFDKVRLPLGFLLSGQATAIWLRRVTEVSAAQTVSLDLKVEWDPQSITFPGAEVDDNCVIGEMIQVKTEQPPFTIGTARIGFSEIG